MNEKEIEAGIILDLIGKKTRDLNGMMDKANATLKEGDLGRAEELFNEVNEQQALFISSLPPTKEFLESRGLTCISQLDEQGREDLFTHLENLRASLAK